MKAIVQLVPRFLMITGIAVMGLVYFTPEVKEMLGTGQKFDFEKILPHVIAGYVPVGLVGILLAGLLFSKLIPPLIEPLHPTLALLPDALLIFPFSAAASVAACLLTPPEKDEILESFCRTVRPWGFWKPVYRKLLDKYPNLKANTDFKRDAFNVAIGIVWQLTLNIIPICLIIGQYRTMWISIVVLAVTSVIMKFTWYDKLGPGDMYMTEDE